MIQSKKVEWAYEPKMQVGSTVDLFTEIAGVKVEFDAEITNWVANQEVTWPTTSGNTTIIYHANLVPRKTGYKLTAAFDYELPYSVLDKLIDKLRVHNAMEKDAERALQKMKSAAENGTTWTPPEI
jgi:uncharacterized membrane protein